MKALRNQSIISDLRNGITRAEVREKYSISCEALKWIVRQYGDESLRVDQALTPDMIQQKLIDNGSALKYFGGYERGGHVLLMCETCGSIMQFYSRSIFKKNLQCKECKRMKREAREQEISEKREADAKARAEASAERKRVLEQERAAKRREVVCGMCGKLFVTSNPLQKRCSAECSRKYNNRIHSHKHDKRIAKDKRINKIELLSLYKRDGGICHICGKQCNLDDYTVTDAAVIAGNWYPSIDHIVPVSKGGADSWDNVKLAHRICNSIRGNRE